MDLQHTIFEYLYRDANNNKSQGELLLSGSATEHDATILIACLEAGNLFVAEQVGIPPLYQKLWATTGVMADDGPAFHEFSQLRPATVDEILEMNVFADLRDIVSAFWNASKQWRCDKSLDGVEA